MMGWTGDSLDRAMAQCNDANGGACNAVTTRSTQDMNDCAIPPLVNEPIDQWLTKLVSCAFDKGLTWLTGITLARLQRSSGRARSRHARHWLRCNHRDTALW